MIEKAEVKTVTFHNPDNGYSVLRLTDARSRKVFTAVGRFPKLSPGELLDLEGEWTQHETFGEQFRSTGYRLVPPDSLEAMERYLGGGVLKGVGPGLAKRLVARFGLQTFEVLDRNPERLDEVPRLKGKAREALLAGWRENQSMREVLYFLQAHHLSANLSARIYKQYGAEAVTTLRQNPYRLAEEVWGVGFLKADEIARKLGFQSDAYERIKAGLAHALVKAAEAGHVFLPQRDLLDKAESLLECDPGKIVFTLDNLSDSRQVVREDAAAAESVDAGAPPGARFYLPYLYHGEKGIARRAAGLCSSAAFPGAAAPIPAADIAAAIRAAEKSFGSGPGFAYSAQQRGGIEEAANRGLFLLTGGPGTGKTTTVLGILEVFRRAGLRVKLAAPTGRAAKRMAEVTGHPASTIHRLLKFDPAARAFVHDESSPLPVDALVVDELSMIDTALMNSLLKGVKPGTRLVLIGDPDQLPSVGPGKVLAELIRSRALPHLHLDRIFRQAEVSLIVANAHRINQGMPPATRAGGDFHLVPCRDPASALAAALDLVCEELPRRGLSPADVQVLTPMNQGPLGTLALNQALQDRLNPFSAGLEWKDKRFRVKDRVMQLRNNYDKNVFNGDIGRVKSVSASARALTVDFDGEEAVYEGEEIDQLALAYAVTVHKSQGSEFRAVVLLLTRAHWIMLQRNLLYTAVTRAREALFLVAQPEAVSRAVEHNPVVDRNTSLAEALREEMDKYAF